jgi:hypothetical protein
MISPSSDSLLVSTTSGSSNNNTNNNSNTVIMASFEQYKREATRLERILEEKVTKYQQVTKKRNNRQHA